MLYQIDQTGVSPEETFAQFWNTVEADDDLKSFAERLVQGVFERREALDALIGEAADNWRIDRMAVVDRNVLRLAAHELTVERDTPPAVVIDEAIEISKKYGSEGSGTFINGILDSIRKKADGDSSST